METLFLLCLLIAGVIAIAAVVATCKPRGPPLRTPMAYSPTTAAFTGSGGGEDSDDDSGGAGIRYFRS